jgi:hypothetical protein
MCSVLFALNPELAVKFFLTFNVFTNAVTAMGTARHYHYVEAAEEGRVSVYTTIFFSLGNASCCVLVLYIGYTQFNSIR